MSTHTRNPTFRDAPPPPPHRAFTHESDLPDPPDPYASDPSLTHAGLQERPRIFRGRTTDELIPRIVSELGSDAIVLRHHQGLTGGFAGFFQRSFVEIEACRGGGQLLDRYDEDDAAPALPGEFEEAAPALPGELENDTPALLERFENAAPALPKRLEDHRAQVEAEADDRLAHDAWGAGYNDANPFAAALADAEAAVRAAEPAVPPDLDAALAAALADAEAAGLPVEPAIRTAHDAALAAALAEAEAEAEAEAAAAEAAQLRAEATPLPDHDPTLANTTSFPQVESVEPSPAVAPIARGRVEAPIARGRAEDAVERALLERTLLEVGFDERFAGEVLDAAAAHLLPLIDAPSPPSRSPLAQAVRRALQQRIPVCPPLPPGPATIALVGPGGSGKSACCASLLDAYHRRSTLPAVSAALVASAGGELEVALGPHFPEPVQIDDPGATRALRGAREEGLLLLDTPPLSPADQASIGALAATLQRLAPDHVVLALPATLGAKPAARLLEAYRPLGTGALAITHTDETDQLGVVVQVACARGLAPAYLLEGDGSEWRLTQIDPADLVDRLLPPQ
jgi:flagellar biosynthesis GTPase FlhF